MSAESKTHVAVIGLGAMGLPMAIGGLLTVSAGVALAHRLPEARMRRLFAFLLLATGLWMLLR